MKEYNLAILGATGAVGHEFINLLNERDFPFKNLKLRPQCRYGTDRTGQDLHRGRSQG